MVEQADGYRFEVKLVIAPNKMEFRILCRDDVPAFDSLSIQRINALPGLSSY